MSTPADRPARLSVGVISAGRVGAVLGAALSRAGHRVVSVAAVSDPSRKRAAELLPGADVRPPDEVAADVDLLLLAVPDDALGALAAGLAVAGTLRRGTMVAHTSGAHGVGVLAPLVEAGALPLALHPVMTFTGTDVDLQRLDGAAWGVTSDEVLRPVAETLVIEMGGEPSFVAEELRPLYHAGLAFAANHLVTLVTQGDDLLQPFGHGRDGLVRQGEAVQHGWLQAAGACRVQVLAIGFAQQFGVAPDGGGDQGKRAVFCGGIGTGHGARSCARIAADFLHVVCDVHVCCHE